MTSINKFIIFMIIITINKTLLPLSPFQNPSFIKIIIINCRDHQNHKSEKELKRTQDKIIHREEGKTCQRCTQIEKEK